MGFISDWKAKKAAKRAAEQHERSLARWNEDVALLGRLIEVFTDASNGKDSVPNYIIQKDEERTLWQSEAVFHETGRTPSSYVGRSSGFSIPVVAGIRYRVGATQGQVVPGVELQMDKDNGIVVLTTSRLIFTGPIKSQEWRFDKLLGASTNEDESDYFFNVSNRKTTSGVRFDQRTGREFNRFFALALSVAEHGYPDVLEELAGIKSRIQTEKPVFVLSDDPAAQLEAPGDK
jgi:hypothetical protein